MNNSISCQRGGKAKFFIIGPQDVITKFKVEILKAPFYRIKERYNFRSYEKLLSFYNAVLKYDEEKNKFGIEI